MIEGGHPAGSRLLDLAAQLLAPQAEAETLRHLESCPACEARFREICRDAELARLRRPEVGRRASRRWAAVAASLILAAVATALWTRTLERDDALAYWFPVDIETVGLRAGVPHGNEKDLHEAVEAYRRRDPARVVALLRERAIPEAYDPLKIVLASALVKTDEPARAEAVLDELRLETLPQPDRDRATWVLYAALTQGGKGDEARALLEALAGRPGEFSEPARRALARSGRSHE